MDVLSTVFSFQDYGELLVLVQNSIWAGAVLGIVGGLIGPFVVARNMPFAVHGISELSFAGASAALLFGVNVVTGSLVGSVVAALLIGLLGSRAATGTRSSPCSCRSVSGSASCAWRSTRAGGEQVRAADRADRLGRHPQLTSLVVVSAIVVVTLLVVWRPLMFSSVDPDVAAAAGVPVRTLAIVFMLRSAWPPRSPCRSSVRCWCSRCSSPRGRRAPVVAPRGRARALDGVRRGVGRGWHPARTRRRPADQPVRHDDLVRDLGRLPHRGRTQGPARTRPDSGPEQTDGGAPSLPSGTDASTDATRREGVTA